MKVIKIQSHEASQLKKIYVSINYAVVHTPPDPKSNCDLTPTPTGQPARFLLTSYTGVNRNHPLAFIQLMH